MSCPFPLTNVNEYMKKFKFDNVRGCRYDPRVFSADCNRTYALQVCMQRTQNNATDDMTKRSTGRTRRTWSPFFQVMSCSCLVTSVNGNAVKFKFDNVYSSCPGARVSDTECDHIRALQA